LGQYITKQTTRLSVSELKNWASNSF